MSEKTPFQGVLAIGLTLCCLSACHTLPKNTETQAKNQINTLLEYLCGDFSSTAQSKRDSDYYDIRLHIRPIWTKDKANHWLYVEQATAKSQDKPYRQRVYKVEPDGQNGYKSIVYTIDEPAKWIGAFKNPASLDPFTLANLQLRDGCTVFLKENDKGEFEGGTRGSGCESNLRGAKYATSKVRLSKTLLLSWDQGFNDKEVQVWGATKGGYEFVKE